MNQCRTALLVYALTFLFVYYFPPPAFEPYHFSSFTTLVVEDTHPLPIALLPFYTQIYLLGNAHLDQSIYSCSQKVKRVITSLEQLDHVDKNISELYVQKDLFKIQHFQSEFINKLQGYTLHLPFKEQYARKCEAKELTKTNRCKVFVRRENSTPQPQTTQEQQVDTQDLITANNHRKQQLTDNFSQNIPKQIQNENINSTVEPQINAQEKQFENENADLMLASQKISSIQYNESPQVSPTDLKPAEPQSEMKLQNFSPLIEKILANEQNEGQTPQQNYEKSADESKAFSQVESNEMTNLTHSEAQTPLFLSSESESKLQEKQQTKSHMEQNVIADVENVEIVVSPVEEGPLQKEKQMMNEQGKAERMMSENDNESNKDASPNEALIANKLESPVVQISQSILNTSPVRNFWEQL